MYKDVCSNKYVYVSINIKGIKLYVNWIKIKCNQNLIILKINLNIKEAYGLEQFFTDFLKSRKTTRV